MNFILSIPLILMLLQMSDAFAYQDKGIYGSDNRRSFTELDLLDDALVIRQSQSVLAQIPNWRISKVGTDTISIDTWSLDVGVNLCPEEKFSNQPIVSSCTAFLVAPDLIMTAGHCVEDEIDCKKQTWVVDYDTPKDFIAPHASVTFSKSQTYTCAELVKWSKNTKADYALIRLNRKVLGREPLKLRRKGKTLDEEMLTIIGHPLGIPKVIVDKIFIRNNSLDEFIVTNADAFTGNSGSPVLGASSGLVEGILIKGDKDFLPDYRRGCQNYARCGDSMCKGETIQRSTELPLKNIPKI